MTAARKPEVGTPYNPYKTDRIIAIIPDFLMKRKEVTPGAKLCYSRLRQHAGEDGRCWPKESTLARETGVSERSVIRYTRELERFRLLRIIRRGQGKSNIYVFLTHAWMYEDQEPDLSEPREIPEPEANETEHIPQNQTEPYCEPETDPPEQITGSRQETPEPDKTEAPETNRQDRKCQSVISGSDNLSPLTFKRKKEKKTAAAPVAAVPSVELVSQAADLIPDDVTVTEGIRKIIRNNIARHGTEYVRRNLLYTNAHIRDKGKYRAYLDRCLRGDWGIDFTEPEPPAASVPTEPEIVRELAEVRRKAEKQRAEGERLAERFLALSEEKQERIRAGFLDTANAFTRKRTGGMDSNQLARNLSFQGFMAGTMSPGT